VRPLTRDEKAAGRAFRVSQQAQWEKLAGEGYVLYPPDIEYPRHACGLQSGRTTTLPMRVVRVHSPEYTVADGKLAGERDLERGQRIPAGLFTFAWRQGECRCGQKAVTEGWIEIAPQEARDGNDQRQG
jgi:hypothetical protein